MARGATTEVDERWQRLRHPPAWVWTGALLILALGVRLAWLAYTGYVEEDAFITFRVARQLAAGNGFVYNLGQHVDGTTTPLFALLLAGWFRLSSDVVLGARLLDLSAGLGTLLLVQQTLQRLGRTAAEQAGALLLLALTSKMVNMETQGMETPLVLFWMAAACYALVRGRATWAGVLCGLLLWTRMDLFLWPLLLAAAAALGERKAGVRLALAAAGTFLPWVLFSTLYFGSPIPQTVTAKWVAYVQFDASPLLNHLSPVLAYLTPLYTHQANAQRSLTVVLTLALAAAGAWLVRRQRLLWVLPAFAVLDLAQLVLTRATFFNRYFVPLQWTVLVLAGIALGKLWERSRSLPAAARVGLPVVLLLALGAVVVSGLSQAADARLQQTIRNQASLTAIGVWLHQHAPPGATVELEPLGYIGYYADRTMLDEVGLVTPAVVALKLQRVPGYATFTYLDPDYLVLHCDDALRMQDPTRVEDIGLANLYLPVREFNPLAFDPAHPRPDPYLETLARNACYGIWQKK